MDYTYNELDAEKAETMLAGMFSNTMTKEEFEAAIVKDYCVVNSGELYFDEPEQAKQAKELINDWIQETTKNELEQMQANSNYVYCGASLQDIQYHEKFSAVTFQVFSETEEHIRHKLNLFLEFCKTLPGFKKFDAPILQTIEPVTWERK